MITHACYILALLILATLYRMRVKRHQRLQRQCLEESQRYHEYVAVLTGGEDRDRVTKVRASLPAYVQVPRVCSRNAEDEAWLAAKDLKLAADHYSIDRIVYIKED